MATYFYQTNLGDLDSGPAECIIVSSLHFGYQTFSHLSRHVDIVDMTMEPYIHLNDWEPNDSRYGKLWLTLAELKKHGKDVAFMLGGAGGAFDKLFSNFGVFSNLLLKFIKEYEVDHLVLDVEEQTRLGNFQHLVTLLKKTYPTLKLSLAPVLSELTNPTEPGAFSGFCYQDLWDSMGNLFYKVYVQMYNGSFTVTSFKQLVDTFTLDPAMLAPGFQSGDCPDPEAFTNAMTELKKMKARSDECGFKLGGCFVWEYFDAPPEGRENPTEWAVQVASILNAT